MLSALIIRDVVLIEALDLEFARGLSVLTGETGAGKSILLDSLGLAMGVRADTGLVRQGAAQASVTAEFEVDGNHPARALIEANGLDSDGAIILRRQLKADGGSRAFINDQPVSAALLRDVGGSLIEIHGQHDDRGLLNARGHRALLDAFGKIETGATAKGWTDWRAAEIALSEARARVEESARDREWLEHAVTELQSLQPEPGEEAMLAEARATMQKGARLSDELVAARELVESGEGGLSKLRQAARRLERLAGEHESLAEALAAVDRAVIEAGEAEDWLAAAAEALSFDPAQLEAQEARLFELRAAGRKHRVAPDDLAALAETLAARAAAIEAGEAEIGALAARVSAARETFGREAARLGVARAQAAVALDAAVARELAPLKLDAARFRTVIEPLTESSWGSGGKERVEFEIATNPGAPFAALLKIASGGELSRFILALKVALAETRTAGTMIFDEIDRGVGGAVASAIGERLARLAEEAQVLVVTHSPQVAARAASQWRIAKASNGDVTRTIVAALDAGERREEIARMLSGAEVTDEARAQADRLLG